MKNPNKLDKAFNQARESEPLFTLNEAAELISAPNGSTRYSSSKKRRIRPMFIYSMLGVITSAALLTWGAMTIDSSEQKPNTSSSKKVVSKNESVKVDEKTIISSKPEKDDVELVKTAVNDTPESSVQKKEEETSKENRISPSLPVKTARMIEMTPEQIKELGVIYNAAEDAIEFPAFTESENVKKIWLNHDKKLKMDIFSGDAKGKIYPKFVSDPSGNRILSLIGDKNSSYIKYERKDIFDDKKQVIIEKDNQELDKELIEQKIIKELEKINPKVNVDTYLSSSLDLDKKAKYVIFLSDLESLENTIKTCKETSIGKKSKKVAFKDLPEEEKKQFAGITGYFGYLKPELVNGKRAQVIYYFNASDREKLDKSLNALKEQYKKAEENALNFKYENKFFARLDKNSSFAVNELKPDTLAYNDLPDGAKGTIAKHLNFSEHKFVSDKIDTSWYFKVIINPGEDSNSVRKDIENRKVIRQAVILGDGKEDLVSKPEKVAKPKSRAILEDIIKLYDQINPAVEIESYVSKKDDYTTENMINMIRRDQKWDETEQEIINSSEKPIKSVIKFKDLEPSLKQNIASLKLYAPKEFNMNQGSLDKGHYVFKKIKFTLADVPELNKLEKLHKDLAAAQEEEFNFNYGTSKMTVLDNQQVEIKEIVDTLYFSELDSDIKDNIKKNFKTNRNNYLFSEIDTSEQYNIIVEQNEDTNKVKENLEDRKVIRRTVYRNYLNPDIDDSREVVINAKQQKILQEIQVIKDINSPNGSLKIEELKVDTLRYSELTPDLKKLLEKSFTFSIHKLDGTKNSICNYALIVPEKQDSAKVKSNIANAKIIRSAKIYTSEKDNFNLPKDGQDILLDLRENEAQLQNIEIQLETNASDTKEIIVDNTQIDSSLSANVNSLIPIALHTEKHKPLFILWFEPSSELLEKLPKQEGEQIQKEILAAESTESVCETGASFVKEESYFDVWYGCSGSVKDMKVFPNPAKDKVNISFHLESERLVTLKVHDMQGKPVMNLFSGRSFKPGGHSESLELHKLLPGMYYIVIETERGEQALQRVIIER